MNRSKWNKRILIMATVAIFILGAGYLGYGTMKEKPSQAETQEVPVMKEETKPVEATADTITPLTQEQKVADFEYLYQTIVENYPYIEVNKRMNGVDFKTLKVDYLGQVKNCETDQEFFAVLSQMIAQLNNGHTQMLPADGVAYMQNVYSYAKKNGDWQGMNFDTINQPLALRRNGLQEMKIEAQTEADQTPDEGEGVPNASVKDIVEGKIGYIYIPQMISMWEIKQDKVLLDAYLKDIKNYEALVIDIRGNGGGDSRYLAEYLLPKMIDKPYEANTYCFYKDGDYIQKYFKACHQNMSELGKVADLDLTKVPMLPPEVKESFRYYKKDKMIVRPAEDSIGFKGNVYLLVDQNVYSSSEMLAMFTKDSGFATIIGSKTGGDGIGSDPLLAMLPNSGYVVRFTKEMGTSGDGTCNEEYKTVPDYEIQETMRKGDMSQDLCIQKVLELEGK